MDLYGNKNKSEGDNVRGKPTFFRTKVGASSKKTNSGKQRKTPRKLKAPIGDRERAAIVAEWNEPGL